MARIRTHQRAERTHVTITGDLTAADMGRLEYACGAALTAHPIALDIDLSRVTAVDRTAVAVLGRLSDRGARIMSPSPGAPRPSPKCGGSETPPAIG
jgi:ABC-type transporter Mla MlaB component